ncbi:MAG: hypothetical protein M3M85_00430 [bacterium]|nr:hypothetical protein [bacterium]
MRELRSLILILFAVTLAMPMTAAEPTYDFWKSKDNQCLAHVQLHDFDNLSNFRDDIYRSPNCRDFWPLIKQSSGPVKRNGKEMYHQEFTDPYDKDKEGYIDADNTRRFLGAKVFEPTKLDPKTVVFHPLPDVRVPEYLFQRADGSDYYVYVSVGKYGGYDSFRLFAGPAAHLKQFPVKEVERYRDGGTTFVWTDGVGVCSIHLRRSTGISRATSIREAVRRTRHGNRCVRTCCAN